MSQSTKKYVPKCSCKSHTFADGGTILKLSFKVEELAAFVRENKNERGYINLIVAERREPGRYGDTHTVYLDEWKPKTEGRPSSGGGARRWQRPNPAPAPAPESEDEPDIPF